MNIREKIAEELKLDLAYISRIADRSFCYYRDYTIPKRNGMPRSISQPSPELKTLQYWVVHNILCKLPVSSAASAYKKGDSIKKNAQLHRHSKHILHADIRNFFPSIRASMLKTILRSYKAIFDDMGLDLEESLKDIQAICFRNGVLCIGAVSSPSISNIVMYSFDTAVLEYCRANGYIYSRYADDIYISSKHYIDKNILVFLQSTLEKNNFKLNESKTSFVSSKSRRKITGLIITNDSQISIGKEKRNHIKKMVYDKLIHGSGDSNQILGYLSFLKDVEPRTYNNIIIKYSQYCDEDLIKRLSK